MMKSILIIYNTSSSIISRYERSILKIVEMIYFANNKSQQEEIILLNDMLNKIMFIIVIQYMIYLS